MLVENQRRTTQIVAAYVRKNFIPTDQIAGLINAVHSTLSGLANEVVEEPPRVPAVSVRRSVRPDHIICIDCGYRGKMLKRHLHSRHGLSVDQYKLRWKLASNYPTTAPNYSERRSQLAKTTGLGRRRAQPPAMPAPAPVMTPEKPARRAANKATGTRPGVKAAKPKTTATARKAGPRTSGKTASNRSRSRNSSSRVASKGASTRRAATSS